jgi:pimeloyl-ACP methyl ester carboxylesterase
MTTFVIVHGAWSGAHAWKWVRPLLRSAGHEVFTPALTGLGERSHLASAQVDLETHVRDVIAVLEYEDLREVVLVGHSYGGMVISGVADRVPERLALLVYLDAEVPMDGQSELDLLPAQERAGYEEAARSKGQGWLIPPPLPEPLPDDLDPRVRWAMLRMVSQPLATFAQPLRLSNPAGPKVPRAYVLCAHGKEDQALPACVQRARSDPGWRFVELAAGHSAHVTAPRELVNVLGQLVEHG